MCFSIYLITFEIKSFLYLCDFPSNNKWDSELSLYLNQIEIFIQVDCIISKQLIECMSL